MRQKMKSELKVLTMIFSGVADKKNKEKNNRKDIEQNK